MNHPQSPLHRLDHYREYLLALARQTAPGRLQAKLDPSDLVQQTLLEAHRCYAQFRGDSSGMLAAWLRSILARQMLNAQRAFAGAGRAVDREQSLEAALEKSSLQLSACLAAPGRLPAESAARHELAVRVAAALGRLPDAQRTAIVLHYWDGLSLKQLAEAMQRTPAAVAGLLKRGLNQLRTLMPTDE